MGVDIYESKYNNWLIAKQIYINMEKRREEREDLTLTNKLDTEVYAVMGLYFK
jgi:hypothetical protein